MIWHSNLQVRFRCSSSANKSTWAQEASCTKHYVSNSSFDLIHFFDKWETWYFVSYNLKSGIIESYHIIIQVRYQRRLHLYNSIKKWAVKCTISINPSNYSINCLIIYMTIFNLWTPIDLYVVLSVVSLNSSFKKLK